MDVVDFGTLCSADLDRRKMMRFILARMNPAPFRRQPDLISI